MRQALDAARMISEDPAVHREILSAVLRWASKADLNQPPPLMGQRIHRRLREITGEKDPYWHVKERQNRMALSLLPELRERVTEASDPLAVAVRLVIAGNVIDMGVYGHVAVSDVRRAVAAGLTVAFSGQQEVFHRFSARAGNILYLADNAGEIVFDRLLIEQLGPARVTLAVRGAPVINDATLTDARAAGLCDMVTVIDNGSDAPGTMLADCSRDFRKCFATADMIIAKGQGNFETLSGTQSNIFFLLQAKCSVIADKIGLPVGTHVLWRDAAGQGAGIARNSLEYRNRERAPGQSNLC